MTLPEALELLRYWNMVDASSPSPSSPSGAPMAAEEKLIHLSEAEMRIVAAQFHPVR